MKKISEEDRKMYLEYEIDYKEAFECIQNMKEAAPGPNGLTLGFFKKYFKYFGHYFVKLLNRKDSIISKTFRHSLIKLIPKNQNKIKTINDLRPISLTNYEYRIRAKIFSNRLYKLSNKLIEDHQTCGIIGRRMNDNLVLVRDLINDSNLRKKELKLIGADQRKAYDSISHTYIFALLDHIELGSFFIENIKKIYTDSYTNILVNGYASEKISINSGIKQGCPLSTMLYILAIEELLIRIKRNPSIKGYMVSGSEIKVTAYADDVTGYLIDERSIKEFFLEFAEWGEISGASLNEEKTEIMHVLNKEKIVEMKILGIYFNNNGITKRNFTNLETKLAKTIDMWQSSKLNIIERVVVIKTFILSKFWFLANFTNFDKKFLKDQKSVIYKFIWNNSQELIKRNSLILPYDKGGLNMVHIEAKLSTINVLNFLYILKSKDRVFYCLSIYWLKFQMKGLIKNFNIIPCGKDEERPKEYQSIISSIYELKKIKKDFISHQFFYKSKNTYNTFKKQYEVAPKCENLERKNFNIDWKSIYNNILDKRLNSDMRAMNYRVLNNGLCVTLKYKTIQKNPCYFCEKKN